MSSTPVTQIDVVRAYVALTRQGRPPSPTNIRLELGRGSYSTIHKHLLRLAFCHPGVRRNRRARVLEL